MHIFFKALIAQAVVIFIILVILKKTLDRFLFEMSVKRIVLLQPKDLAKLTQVIITSHGNLKESRKDVYRKAVAKRFGERVTAEFRVDPGIMGGFIVKMGETVYDDSLRDRLRQAVEKR